MKAVAVWQQQKRVGIVEEEPPALASSTAAEIRVLDVGVCGTDAEICSFAYGDPPAGAGYLVVGHEALGQVVRVGADVSRVKAGNFVVPTVRRPCPHEHCPACRMGRQDFCVTGDYTERGIKEAHGFLAERVVEEERYLTVVPAALRDVGVLTEPLTIAEKALRQYADVQRRLPWLAEADDEEILAGRRAVVLGAGPVGILGAMLLAARGCETVVYSRARTPNAKAELVESVGAAYVSSEEEELDALVGRIGPVDLVYEAAGASRFAFDVLERLGTNGVFVFTGIPGGDERAEVAADAIMKNLVLGNQVALGTVNASRDAFEAAVRDLALFDRRWPGALRALITGRYPMEEFCGQAGAKEGIKRVIAVGEPA